MNLRRGLIRLWIFCSVIWIGGVVMVAMNDPGMRRADRSSASFQAKPAASAPNAAPQAPAAEAVEPAEPDWFTGERSEKKSQQTQQAAPAAEWWKADQPAQQATPAAAPQAAAPANWWDRPEFMGGQKAAPAATPNAEPWAAFRGGAQRPSAPTRLSFDEAMSDLAAQEIEQKTDIRRTFSKYARMALGPPIILLMLGAGVAWVATGFKSGPTR